MGSTKAMGGSRRAAVRITLRTGSYMRPALHPLTSLKASERSTNIWLVFYDKSVDECIPTFIRICDAKLHDVNMLNRRRYNLPRDYLGFGRMQFQVGTT